MVIIVSTVVISRDTRRGAGVGRWGHLKLIWGTRARARTLACRLHTDYPPTSAYIRPRGSANPSPTPPPSTPLPRGGNVACPTTCARPPWPHHPAAPGVAVHCSGLGVSLNGATVTTMTAAGATITRPNGDPSPASPRRGATPVWTRATGTEARMRPTPPRPNVARAAYRLASRSH
jgi:hypothetical protein